MGKREKRERRNAERRERAEAKAAHEAEQEARYFQRWRTAVCETACPACGTHAVAQYFYGLPHFTERLDALLSDDLLVLGGCDYDPDAPLWVCRSCLHTWGELRDLAALMRVWRSIE